MKFVLNHCYGRFSLSDWAKEKMGCSESYRDDPDLYRDDPDFISLVEQYPDKVSDDCAELEVVEIPDDCTDYEFIDCDGMESIIYVVDGKIHHA